MKKNVLVVDDEREIVDFLENFMTRLGIAVTKAIRGGDAIEICRKSSPDCVFLDIQMPDKNGMAVLKELKDIDKSMKVIMITSKEQVKFQEQAKKLGAVDYITKPLDLAELNKKIRIYLSLDI